MAFRHPRKESLVNRFYPNTDDADGARAATRNAAIAGFVSAGLTLLLVLLSGSVNLGELGSLINVWALIDVGIMVALAFGTLRANRYAATGLLAYYLVNQLLTRIEIGFLRGIGLTLVFTVLFVQGARGAWALYRRSLTDDLDTMVDALARPDEASA